MSRLRSKRVDLRPKPDATPDVALTCTGCGVLTGVYLVLAPAPAAGSFRCARCLDPRHVAFDERGRVSTAKAAA